MEVEELTINTHKVLYRYLRLPFGVASAPSLFQKSMEQILQGIEGVVVYLDDLQVTGTTMEEHLQRLDRVLQRLEKFGLRLQVSKCKFAQEKVEYLGHAVDKEGLRSLPDKVKAITDARSPTNVTELRAFLGIIQYYARFLPNLSTELSPLHALLKEQTPWCWTTECQTAFQRTKQLLTSASVLTHYDVERPIRLECDASSVGLGAVPSHEMADGHTASWPSLPGP